MNHFPTYPISRPRRLRRTPALRELVQETRLSIKDLVYPLFVCHGSERKPIKSMPNQFQYSLQSLEDEIKNIEQLGIQSVIIFGIPEHKDRIGSDNLSSLGIAPRAISLIKKTCPGITIISDLCLCDYTDHGHCCLPDNSETLGALSKGAVIHAQAGSDMIAPSGMVDGMVSTIRSSLDEARFTDIPIMSYSAKYASAFYAPFREAAECAPQLGNRKAYQLDPPNAREALKEMALDIAEGADILMVKPAGFYLDIIHSAKTNFKVPIAAYQVSGEYSMLIAAAQNGWIDLKASATESLMGIKRAGANIILTYFAKDFAQWNS